MSIIPLKRAIELHSQEGVAALLGITQGAVSQAVIHKRNIYLLRNKGNYTAFEVKPAFNTNPDLEQIKKTISDN